MIDINALNKRLSRLKLKYNKLYSEHKGNEINYTYWGGQTMGYLKGKIAVIEDILDEIETNIKTP